MLKVMAVSTRAPVRKKRRSSAKNKPAVFIIMPSCTQTLAAAQDTGYKK